MVAAKPLSIPVANEKSEAILAAALELFVERGFYGTAVPEVARRAGVAAGSIYTYFPSKEALVNALFRKWKRAFAEKIFAVFPLEASPREQFDVMWREMTSCALEHRAAFAFLELHHHASYLDDESRAIEHQLKEFAAGALRRGQSLGAVKKLDPALLMELVFGAFVGMMRAHWEHRADLDDAILDEARAACWDLLALSPAART